MCFKGRFGRYETIGVIAALLIGIFAIVGRSYGQETEAKIKVLTLKEAIEIALKNQPLIEAQQGQALSAEAKLGQAQGNYYPHLSIGTSYTRIWPVNARTSASTSLSGLPPGTTIPSGTTAAAKSYEQYAASANLNQLVFDFGKTPAQVAAQKATSQAARFELQNVQDQVVFTVKQAYYNLLGAQQNRDVALEAVEQFKKHLAYAKALFEAGAKPKFDVTKAEVDLSNSEVELIKAENAVNVGKILLNNAIGMPYGFTYLVEEDRAAERREQSFEDAARLAFEHRPDLLALQKQKEAAQESIKAARRGHLPTFQGTASFVYVGTEFPLDHGWTAGGNMVIPIFNGFITSYQVAEAQASLMTASANERNLKQTIILELEQGFLARKEASQRMQSAWTAVKQGKENLELANERYAAGLAIGVEVTDAVVSHANAQTAAIAAFYDFKVAEARIDKAIGSRP